MNNISAQSTLTGLSLQSRTVAFTAIVLFALSGLISGFAVGAFVHPNFALPTHDTGSHTAVQNNQAQTPVSTEHPIPLGFPVIDQSSNVEIADGTTLYTLSAYAVDQSIDKAHGKPVHQPGMTCRLWLIPMSAGSPSIPLDRLKSPDTLQSSPLPGEVQGLMFDPTTAQTQPCNANGQGIWKYRLDPSVIPGTYYLVVLTDWQGTHYNWSWITVTIKKPGQ
jgi:hypothetical protein